jgi:excisionase family DNA binding protein
MASILNIISAAEEYGLALKTLKAAITAGELKAIKVGRATLVERSDLETWLRRQRERAANEN